MIQVYYGDGKGKTTACVGLAIRAAGAGIPVLFAQYLKDGNSNEFNILKNISNIEVYENISFEGFVFEKSDSEKRDISIQYEQSINDVVEWIENLEHTTGKTVDAVIVLDEVLHCINMGLVDENRFLSVLKSYNDRFEFVLSGGEPTENIKKLADYVTCVKKDKHPYDAGCAARSGIEK